MKHLARSLWRYSWAITLPLSALFLHWGWATAERFYTFKVRYDPAPSKVQLRDIGTTEFLQLVRRWELACTSAFTDARKPSSRLRDIALFVPEAHLAELHAHLPYTGYDYVRGGLWHGNRVQQVDVRYRGDHVHHWGDYKKSYRVRTKKGELFEGMRTFNLNVPMTGPQIQNHVCYKLAQQLQLIAPRSELVNVVLNGEHRGTHILIEQLNELTFRRHDLKPGDFYAGELVAKDSYPGIDMLVWDHPGLWQKKTFNDRYPPESREPLRRLTELINSVPSETAQRELNSLLDVEAWGRFTAFETLTQSFHFNRSHNWRLYFDPIRGKFVPVVWDPMGWAWSRDAPAQYDVLTSRLQAKLAQNGNVLRARHQAIQQFYASGGMEQFLQQVDTEIDLMEEALVDDPNLIPVDPAAIVVSMHSYRNTIARVLAEIERGYLADTGRVDYAAPMPGRQTVSISFSGRTPVNRLILQYRQPIDSDVSTRVRYWRNGRRFEVDVPNVAHSMSDRVEVATVFLPNFQAAINNQPPARAYPQHLVPRVAYYEVDVEGLPPTNQLLGVLVERGREGITRARAVPELDRRSFSEIHAVIEPSPPTQRIRWQGVVNLSGTTRIDAPVTIAPGTTIRLERGATLVLQNRLLALGTAKEPISFQPAEEDQDGWGAIVLLGPATDGSVLEHCNVAGGRGHQSDLSDYSGMVSIYNAGRVDLLNCRFEDSGQADDMLHAVRSEMHIRNCAFTGAAVDAVDLDFCRATIEDCRIESSGADGVDLRSSQVVVTGTLFRGNRDKGVSIEDESRLTAIDSRFDGNATGLRANNNSLAILYNVDLKENGVAINAQHKRGRYRAGGSVYVYKSRSIGNQQQVATNRKSHVWVCDSYLDSWVDEKRVTLHDSPVSGSRSRAHSRERFPGVQHEAAWVEDKYWDRMRPARRGSVTVGG